MKASQRILLTGATGYVGGRLLPLLVQHGHQVRCLVRNAARLKNRFDSSVEVFEADLLDADSLEGAFDGIDTAYYFVHSMGTAKEFAAEDRIAADNFAQAARRAGVRRIIYLGGLGDSEHELSRHLQSRQDTGEILRSTGIEVIEFRASIIIGSGSLSFEMIRALVERLPVMICPRWVRVQAQPIAIEDVLDYLLEALKLAEGSNRTFEIGGPEPVTYAQIMQVYARRRNLWRLMIPVPVLSSRLSSLWLGLVTPLYARIGRKLVDSLRNPTIVKDTTSREVFPIQPRSLEDAIDRALVNEDREFAETRWSDAFSSGGRPKVWGGRKFGSRLVDSRCLECDVPPEVAFQAVQRIGGKQGWYYGNFLWRIRGFLDLLVGGVGLRRGRRHPVDLRVGDALDFWRVEAVEPGRRIRLYAEMKLPGRAWLEFEVEPQADGAGSVIRQTALFDPIGLFGLAYWYGIYPLHQFVFAGMLRGVVAAAQDIQADEESDSASPSAQHASK